MTDRPLLLDLFCGAGGAAVGYHRAGFDVVGVDVNDQPRYPFAFERGDAFVMGRKLLEGGWSDDDRWPLRRFAAVHASPPCQRYTIAQSAARNADAHPDLIPQTRALLEGSALPYVIENVPGAPLRHPIRLCGSSFALTRIRRHRLFESNVELRWLACNHRILHDTLSVTGHNEGGGARHRGGTKRGEHWGAAAKRDAMGVPWMNRDELREAIPPAFTEYIGRQLLAAIA